MAEPKPLTAERYLTPFPRTVEDVRRLDNDTLATVFVLLNSFLQTGKLLGQVEVMDREERILYLSLLSVVIAEITNRKFRVKKSWGTCAVCRKEGVVGWCEFCKKWICDRCRTDYPARIRATSREILDKIRSLIKQER
jgi:hypothetical protein